MTNTKQSKGVPQGIPPALRNQLLIKCTELHQLRKDLEEIEGKILKALTTGMNIPKC